MATARFVLQKPHVVEEEDQHGTQPDRHCRRHAVGVHISGPSSVHAVLQPRL